MDKKKKNKDDLGRKRGRPSGKNRKPLSPEERRARNAQYERERRYESAQAMAQLSDAAGCDPNLTHADLLATVINYIQNAAKVEPTENVNELRSVNTRLLAQISDLERCLAKPQRPNGNDDDACKGCTAARTTSVKIFMKNSRKKKLQNQREPLGNPLTESNVNGGINASPSSSFESLPIDTDPFINEQDRDFLTSFGWLDSLQADGRGS